MYELRVKGEFITVHADEGTLVAEQAKYTEGWNFKERRPKNPRELGWKGPGNPYPKQPLAYNPDDVTVEPKRAVDVVRNGSRVDTAHTPEDAGARVDELVKRHLDHRQPHTVVRSLRRRSVSEEEIEATVRGWYSILYTTNSGVSDESKEEVAPQP